MRHSVVLVLACNLMCLLKPVNATLLAEKVKICFHIVILDPQGLVGPRLFKTLKYANCFFNSVLKLQVVNEYE